MEQSRIHLLVKKYLDQNITEAEVIELTNVLMEDQSQEQVENAFDLLLSKEEPSLNYDAAEWDKLYYNIIKETSGNALANSPFKLIRLDWRKWAAAAAVVGLMVLSALLALDGKQKQIIPIVVRAVDQDIAPGKEGAILTLADGNQLVLDSLGNGVIAHEDGTQVAWKDGELLYESAYPSTKSTLTYHTMSTPKGRQFHLILPDGTQVWLNAASSIKYPTRFIGHERRVEVFGEVYFEVAKNKRQPFRVVLGNQAEVEVLGTHFNVHAYKDEKSAKTTLLEGSVKVKPLSSTTPWSILKPGQQAQVTHRVKIADDVELDKVMAWKNGLFNFEGASFEEVMTQLSRWYDIEVVYEKAIPTVEFGGKMSRNVPLSDVLRGLKDLNINFRIEGRKLVVLD